MPETIIILDFGSQYSQLITRRVREAQVYGELMPWDASEETVMAHKPKGFILSGGPNSVYAEDAPHLPDFVLASGLPVIGICYGMQVLTHSLGGKVAPAGKREYGPSALTVIESSLILAEQDHPQVWMSHGDRIEQPPEGFAVLAKTANSPIAAIGDTSRGYFGLQFHPEVHHTPAGFSILQRFVRDVCGCRGDWTPRSIIDQSIERIREQVGKARVLSAEQRRFWGGFPVCGVPPIDKPCRGGRRNIAAGYL